MFLNGFESPQLVAGLGESVCTRQIKSFRAAVVEGVRYSGAIPVLAPGPGGHQPTKAGVQIARVSLSFCLRWSAMLKLYHVILRSTSLPPSPSSLPPPSLSMRNLCPTEGTFKEFRGSLQPSDSPSPGIPVRTEVG